MRSLMLPPGLKLSSLPHSSASSSQARWLRCTTGVLADQVQSTFRNATTQGRCLPTDTVALMWAPLPNTLSSFNGTMNIFLST